MKIIINKELADLNTYVNANRSHYRVGNALKQEETEFVYLTCLEQKIKPIKQFPAKIEFNWYSKNERKDIDNVCFAKKFILDGMVKAKVLPNDSRKYVNSLSDNFFIDKKLPRVEINY